MAAGGIEPPSPQLTVRRSTARPLLPTSSSSGIKPPYLQSYPKNTSNMNKVKNVFYVSEWHWTDERDSDDDSHRDTAGSERQC